MTWRALLGLAVAGGVTLAASSGAAVLYAVAGDGASPAETLYVVDLDTAVPTFARALGNGDDGEAIAFYPPAGLLYHASGATDGDEFLESVIPADLSVGPNLVPGNTYGPDPAQEFLAFAWYEPDEVFLAIDNFGELLQVTPAGEVRRIGSSTRMRGFAVVGRQVFGVDPASPALYEIHPATGALLATLPLSVDGVATSGNGLATHPATGVVYAILKNPADPEGGRLLATLDVATGAATSIGDTGEKLAGITFAPAPLYAISGDGASPPETLYVLNRLTALPRFALTLGNGADGEGIAYHPPSGLLYHSSGFDDGNEYLETVNPLTLAVGPNLAPGNTYGPSPAAELLALGWYPPLGVFLAVDEFGGFYHVSPDGAFDRVGSAAKMRGFAVVGAQVFAVDPTANNTLLEIDPSEGTVLNTLPLTVDGFPTSGNGLATDPDTGVVYALVKNPGDPGGGRLLATLDVLTGSATSIGNTGEKLAGVTFLAPRPAIAKAPVLEPTALAFLAATLLAAGRLARRRPLGLGPSESAPGRCPLRGPARSLRS